LPSWQKANILVDTDYALAQTQTLNLSYMVNTSQAMLIFRINNKYPWQSYDAGYLLSYFGQSP